MTEQDNILLIQEQLAAEFNIVPAPSPKDRMMQLAAAINHLIQKDFSALVNILYRLDVSEARIKLLLQEQPDKNAGELIAGLIVARQLEKLKSRAHFRQSGNIPDDEKW